MWMRSNDLLGLVPVLAVLALAGCPCTVEELDRWVYDDWESCEGLCGWEVLEGRARVVQTYHPAEHALELESARTTIRRALDAGARDTTEMQLGLVTSCAEGESMSLSAQAIYRDPAGVEVPRVLTLDCSSAAGALWYCASTVDLLLTVTEGEEEWPLTALLLEGSKAGCVVDDVILETFRLFCGA
jgi:hypothetical protein